MLNVIDLIVGSPKSLLFIRLFDFGEEIFMLLLYLGSELLLE